MRGLAFIACSMLIATTARAAEAEKPKLVVMPLQTSGLATTAAVTLDELLADAVRRVGTYQVVGKSDIEAMLGLENIKDQLGCDDVTCAAQLGGALGAEFLLTGRVAKLGDNIIVVLKLINTRENKVLASAKHKVADNENLYESALEAATRELFGLAPPTAPSPAEPGPTEVGVLRITTEPPGAAVLLDGKLVGQGPVTIPSVAAGVEHAVKVELQGWLPREEKVSVVRGETLPLVVRLEERPRGRQGWSAAPRAGEGLRLMVDNNYSAPFTEAGISAGYTTAAGVTFGGRFTYERGAPLKGGWYNQSILVFQLGSASLARFSLSPSFVAGLAMPEGQEANGSPVDSGGKVGLHTGSGFDAKLRLTDWLSLGVSLEVAGTPPVIVRDGNVSTAALFVADLHSPMPIEEGPVFDAPWAVWVIDLLFTGGLVAAGLMISPSDPSK